MINKVYEIIKKYIKENWLFLLLIILIICFNFYKTGYSIYKPGGTINSSERISGDNLYKSKGSFNMAYVGMLEGNLPIYLLSKIMPEWESVKNSDIVASDKETIEDSYKRNELDYTEAISNATYVALTSAKVDFNITKTSFYVMYLTDENKSNLKIGDELLKYDDTKFSSVKTFISYIQNKDVKDKILLTYKRNNKIYTTKASIYMENNTKYLGISVGKIMSFKSKYNIKVLSKSSESGPSGGLITTLSIYNSLVKEDITKGKKIVGTGTIDEESNVGEIGSVTYKLASAEKDNADMFICPKANYKEAIKYAKKHNYDIIIKGVSTFNEALKVLKEMES